MTNQDNPPVPAAPSNPDRSNHQALELRSLAIAILAFLALCAAFYFAREILIPVAFALLFNIILRPVVRGLEKMHIPTTLAAGIVVLVIVGLLTFLSFRLSNSVANWMHEVPHLIESAKGKFEKLRAPVQQMADVAKQIKSSGQGPTTAPAATPAPPEPNWLLNVMGSTAQIFTAILEILFLLFLLLASGDLFLQKLVKVIPLWQDKKAAIEIVHESQSIVMRYILLNAIVMACQGVVVALVLWGLGMPKPWIWGILSFSLELIPYLGAALMVGMLAVAGFATFDNMAHALAIPASYFIITTLQTSAISPFAYGKRLKLNPIAVFVGVLFWWFLWGIPGAYLAVPIIAMIKIVADRTENFTALGEFLGE